jgi:hypothetical protein
VKDELPAFIGDLDAGLESDPGCKISRVFALGKVLPRLLRGLATPLQSPTHRAAGLRAGKGTCLQNLALRLLVLILAVSALPGVRPLFFPVGTLQPRSWRLDRAGLRSVGLARSASWFFLRCAIGLKGMLRVVRMASLQLAALDQRAQIHGTDGAFTPPDGLGDFWQSAPSPGAEL